MIPRQRLDLSGWLQIGNNIVMILIHNPNHCRGGGWGGGLLITTRGYSDDSFFDFEGLSRAEVQEEMINNIVKHTCNGMKTAPYVADIDPDGDVIPTHNSALPTMRRAQMLEFAGTARSDDLVDASEFNEPSVALRR